jgi:hypothetical protein
MNISVLSISPLMSGLWHRTVSVDINWRIVLKLTFLIENAFIELKQRKRLALPGLVMYQCSNELFVIGNFTMDAVSDLTEMLKNILQIYK